MDELEKWETQFRKGLTEVLVMLAVAQQKQTYGYQLLIEKNSSRLCLEVSIEIVIPHLLRNLNNRISVFDL